MRSMSIGKVIGTSIFIDANVDKEAIQSSPESTRWAAAEAGIDIGISAVDA